ncbi:MAG: hypothetical protein IJJ43_06310 [Oscillospiraceae bacterium]|nr:hypothetical protein [Oscillospiraceae bacterium]MBQ6465861.1 hypothetical protein [Oscillospiraceae bacterium]
MCKPQSLDSYETLFGKDRFADLIKEVEEMEANSKWIPDVETAGMTVKTVDGRPLFVTEEAKEPS